MARRRGKLTVFDKTFTVFAVKVLFFYFKRVLCISVESF